MASAAEAVRPFELADVPFRRNGAGRQLMARLYRPAGAGPFPMVLDLHGGAWQRKDRTANEPMDRALAATGVLVAAIDLTLSGEAPYPAALEDARAGLRWLRANAAPWNGDATQVAVLGSSSGGHLAQLLALRPEGEALRCVATRAPISDPHARWLQAQNTKRADLVAASGAFFRPWETIFDGNPQAILDRGEAAKPLPPMLVMHGTRDDNVTLAVQEKFAASYRAAGGECDLVLFEGCEHEWVATPGPQTERAHETVKAFLARRLRKQE